MKDLKTSSSVERPRPLGIAWKRSSDAWHGQLEEALEEETKQLEQAVAGRVCCWKSLEWIATAYFVPDKQL